MATLREFRARFPGGGIAGDLIQLDRGQYIVRVSVRDGNTILATALAAGDTVEEAENAARQRALDAIALDVLPVATPLTPPVASSTPADLADSPTGLFLPEPEPPYAAAPSEVVSEPEPNVRSEVGEALSPESSPGSTDWSSFAPSPTGSMPVSTPAAAGTQPNWWDDKTAPHPLTPEPYSTEPPPSAAISPEPQREPLPAPKKKSTRSKSATSKGTAKAAAKGEPENSPIDYSDIIARTNVELKRLRWNSEQGRQFLEETYGKRSRQLLDETELLEFLTYLEAQPTPR
ncbi:hypothetical protein KR51_00025580 [Rubidibacter lacunae KORDI 51-2]|uniref:Uncharacterized protein n=2 Tax=Rubidibacter TaxID=582491 RepID=U5DMB1_9CHRO|nr:hypothetical protein KR51_00025580 [Rubidibacter lacunae KORDI 51-2]